MARALILALTLALASSAFSAPAPFANKKSDKAVRVYESEMTNPVFSEIMYFGPGNKFECVLTTYTLEYLINPDRTVRHSYKSYYEGTWELKELRGGDRIDVRVRRKSVDRLEEEVYWMYRVTGSDSLGYIGSSTFLEPSAHWQAIEQSVVLQYRRVNRKETGSTSDKNDE